MTNAMPYSPFPNRFRQDLIAGKKLIGCWASLGIPITSEVLGVAGFDWILLDAEHAPNDVLTLVPQLMALKDSVSAPVVRPPWNDTVVIKRLLDAGFHNFLVPFVGECRRSPRGRRRDPISAGRGARRFGVPAQQSLRLRAQLASTSSTTASRAGRSKASASPLQQHCAGWRRWMFTSVRSRCGVRVSRRCRHPEVQKQGRCSLRPRRRKAVGILAPVEADARRYMELGATFVAVGSDLGVLRMATQALKDKYRDPEAMPISAQY
jgi:2-dehydro-3-deoxyglucarate aldolase